MSDGRMKEKVALVLGATGGIGGHLARVLRSRGYTVRALSRGITTRRWIDPRFQWIEGDALCREDVVNAAHGASLIVHAVNPPGYLDWHTTVLPMLDNTIAAAKLADARILLPGSLYNYGPDAFPAIYEDSPQNPRSRKGKIRMQMELRLKNEANRGLKVLIVRTGDYFGPGAGNSWFSQALVKPGRQIGVITNPGRPGIGHQWAYLPDVAQTMLKLVDQEADLPHFSVFQMQGFWDSDGLQLHAAIERVVGHCIGARRFPWWVVRLASPFVPFFRELNEMRYLWTTSVRMNNEQLIAFLGYEPRTDIDVAVRATLVDLCCFSPPRLLDGAVHSMERSA